MRLAFINILTATVFTYCTLRSSTSGQWALDPSISFEGLEFDQAPRGQFNITPCIKDLMNCYEIIKPEVHCTYVQDGRRLGGYYYNISFHGSACDIMKIYCHDVYGYRSELKKHWFNMPRKTIDEKRRDDCREFGFT